LRLRVGLRAVVFDIGELRLGELEYRSIVAGHCGLDPLPPDYEAAVTPSMVPSVRPFPPIPEMLAVGAELRTLGLRTAVLSNTQASHVRVILTMGFLDGFDPVLFVDDMPENVSAAVALGLRGIQHNGDAATTRDAIWQML